MIERTQVAIIGAGPAGLLLAQVLQREGVESIVLERRDRAYVEGRIRAGILEMGTVAMMRRAGAAGRLESESRLTTASKSPSTAGASASIFAPWSARL